MFDLARIGEETFVRAFDFHETLGSTNDRAIEVARTWDGAFPYLVLTLHQTGGRGRGANVWWSSEGSLTFSLLIDASELKLPGPIWPQLSLASGLAVCEAVESFLPEKQLQLKWPNDVFLESRKVSGMLVEVPDPKASRLVIGIGLNVNNSVRTAPIELREIVTTMNDASGRPFSLTETLIAILQRLEIQLLEMAASPSSVREQWSRRCLLTGRTVTLRAGSEESTGICRGIDGEGRSEE
ncbi:MAG: biotin--[acetyl-CoA-carboxylase] ligase, partial [Planctomycetaceae bacterium]